jgi:hypothetical protein
MSSVLILLTTISTKPFVDMIAAVEAMGESHPTDQGAVAELPLDLDLMQWRR